MNEVYVIAGGEWLRNNLNAIAAFMNTRTWDSIEKIALTLSVVAVAWHCCKVSDEAAFCLIQRPYISKTLLTRRISPRGSP